MVQISVFPSGFQTVCDVLVDGISQDKILTSHAVKCIYWNRKENINVSYDMACEKDLIVYRKGRHSEGPP